MFTLDQKTTKLLKRKKIRHSIFEKLKMRSCKQTVKLPGKKTICYFETATRKTF